ncbi:MAG: MarR family winged helix-turn-helix transcriptional regulator [Candidatus Berkelbacteria bacterium]
MAEQIITNLSNKEITALKSLARLKRATILQLSKSSGLKRTTLYNFIDRLVDMELIKSENINGTKFFYIYKKLPTWVSPKPNKPETKYKSFEILTTNYAIKRAVFSTLRAKNKKVEWLVGSPKTTNYLGKGFIEKYITESLKTNVFIRTMRSPLTEPKHKYGGEEAIAKFHRVMRIAQSTLPFKTTFTIHDDTIIFISSDHGGVGYKITDTDLAQSFRYIFDGLWKYSKVIGKEDY